MRVALKDYRGKIVGTWDGPSLVADRDAIGPGEIFELILLDGDGDGSIRPPDPPIVRPPDPPIDPPIDPPPGWPPHIVPREGVAYVAECKAYLTAQGQGFATVCGSHTIARMAAWGLRESGWGLLDKPGGNNCDGYSVDVIMHRDGRWVDVIIGSQTTNTPAWQVGDGPMPADRWRAPVRP